MLNIHAYKCASWVKRSYTPHSTFRGLGRKEIDSSGWVCLFIVELGLKCYLWSSRVYKHAWRDHNNCSLILHVSSADNVWLLSWTIREIHEQSLDASYQPTLYNTRVQGINCVKRTIINVYQPCIKTRSLGWMKPVLHSAMLDSTPPFDVLVYKMYKCC